MKKRISTRCKKQGTCALYVKVWSGRKERIQGKSQIKGFGDGISWLLPKYGKHDRENNQGQGESHSNRMDKGETNLMRIKKGASENRNEKF